MTAQKDTILIVGTGAMACLFAARLALAGEAVAMLGTWEEGLLALSQKGISLQERDGSQRLVRVLASKIPADFRGVKQVLVLVKSWQTERAARQLVECLEPDGIALTLQNGMGNYEILAGYLGDERVFLGSTTAGASLLGPGSIRSAGEGVVVIEDHPKLKRTGERLGESGFAVEWVADPRHLLWGKLVINASINPLTALLRVPNGELLARPSARSLMASIALESALVAEKVGVRLPYTDPVQVVEDVARRTAVNLSSMLQDVLRGAPTEIDAISGALTRAGEENSVPVPLNRTLWKLVKALSQESVELIPV